MGQKILFVIDCQNDFISGSLGSEDAQQTVPVIVERIKKARDEGWTICYTQDSHDMTYMNTLEGQKLPISHCMTGTWGWRLCDEIEGIACPNDVQICKNTFGAIQGIYNIISDIEDNDFIEEVEFCGFCTSICVAANATILRAFRPNLKISVNKNLCADISKENHEAGLLTMSAQQIDIIE